ncbi:MAG: hypothetical protein QG661_2953 [Actinomycetota bacterium]|nr:hypothetical protein [Actinomycetota bacterium]MDQ5975744.1 hypothetical protein [Actinomycetota bacterium]
MARRTRPAPTDPLEMDLDTCRTVLLHQASSPAETAEIYAVFHRHQQERSIPQ